MIVEDCVRSSDIFFDDHEGSQDGSVRLIRASSKLDL